MLFYSPHLDSNNSIHFIIFNATNFSPDYKKSFFTITLINNAATNIFVQVVYSQTNYLIFCYLFNIGLLNTYYIRPRG